VAPPPNNQPALPRELVLLGLLAEEPGHAYALEEKIRARNMTEWTEIALSSIYRLLDRLAKQDLISAKLEQGGRGAARKVYAIRAAGRRVLAEGVLHYLDDLTPTKSPFHVSLAFITEAGRAAVLETLERRRGAIGRAREQLASLARDVLARVEEADHVSCAGQTLRARLLFAHIQHHIRAELSFLDEALALVEGTAEDQFGGPPRRSS
jgi:DNA-binding PadR family transcriptional regulator